MPAKALHAVSLAPRTRSGRRGPCPGWGRGRALSPRPSPLTGPRGPSRGPGTAARPSGSPGNAADAAAATRGHGRQGGQEEGALQPHQRLIQNVRAPGEREGGRRRRAASAGRPGTGGAPGDTAVPGLGCCGRLRGRLGTSPEASLPRPGRPSRSAGHLCVAALSPWHRP